MYRTHKRALMGVIRPFGRIGTICSAEGDDPGAGGGDPPGGAGGQATIPGTEDPPKTFTQEELNAFLAKERKATEAKFKDYDELKAAADKVAEMNKRLEELEEEKQLAGKSAEEKERARAKKERETLLADKERLAAEKAEADAKLEAAVAEHRMTRARHTLSLALSSAKVYAPAAGDALDAMMRDSELEFGDDGALKRITLNHDGVVYDDMTKAATAYLAAKPHYAAGALGGTGTRPPTGGTGTGGKALKEMTREERLKHGNALREARANR